ncbi:MAG: alcohol dehydrogenase [Arcobacter sp.]|nr:MAG: alcohol dehydrogenase [Arcobacter sp.]
MKKSQITINYTQSIKDALNIIDKGAKRIAVVLDNKKKVIGTISDGDIRRGLLKSLSLDSSIENIYYKNPILGEESDSKEFLIQKAIANQVYQIPIVDKDRKLIDIIDLATLIKVRKRNNRVILMAGGLGTRLRPLTENMPKPLLKVGNKPILETIIRNFAKHGFENITISVNYKAAMIEDYFKDGKEFGVHIDYIREEKRLGTAGALSLINDIPKEPFFVMNADLLTDADFENMLHFHHKENSIATMCVREYDFQVPYGVIQTKGSHIKSIVEKPIQKFFVNAGIYLLSPKVLKIIPQNEFYDMPTLFNELINENNNVVSFPLHEYWIDIGRIEEYEKANIEYTKVF